MTTGLVCFIAGAAAMAVYNHLFSARVEKVGQDIKAAFEQVKGKL